MGTEWEWGVTLANGIPCNLQREVDSRSALEHLPPAHLGRLSLSCTLHRSVPVQLQVPADVYGAGSQPATRPGPGWREPKNDRDEGSPREAPPAAGARLARGRGTGESRRFAGCRTEKAMGPGARGAASSRVKFTEAALEPQWVRHSQKEQRLGRVKRKKEEGGGD